MSTGRVIEDATWVRPRRSGRGRFGTILALVVLATLAGGFGVRAWRSSGVPDAPEPFDIEAERRAVVPEATNAYPLIARAWGMLGPEIAKFAPISSRRDQEWATASDQTKAWVETYRPALLVFREATARPDLRPVTPGSESELAILRDLPKWSQCCLLEAGRLEAAGDLAAAWDWHGARLRAMLLVGHWGEALDRRHASYHLDKAIARAQVWADHPGMTAPLLRRAIADVEAMSDLFPRPSDILRRDYPRVLAEIDSPELPGPSRVPAPGTVAAAVPTVARFRMPEPLRPLARRVDWWLAGEPSRSRRLVRLLYANWLAQADRPADRRSRVVSESPLVFDTDPGTTPPLTPDRLARAAESAPILNLFLNDPALPFVRTLGFDRWREALAVDRRACANLIVALAVRIHEIETGKYPASPGELVGKTLTKLPDDYGRARRG